MCQLCGEGRWSHSQDLCPFVWLSFIQMTFVGTFVAGRCWRCALYVTKHHRPPLSVQMMACAPKRDDKTSPPPASLLLQTPPDLHSCGSQLITTGSAVDPTQPTNGVLESESGWRWIKICSFQIQTSSNRFAAVSSVKCEFLNGPLQSRDDAGMIPPRAPPQPWSKAALHSSTLICSGPIRGNFFLLEHFLLRLRTSKRPVLLPR